MRSIVSFPESAFFQATERQKSQSLPKDFEADLHFVVDSLVSDLEDLLGQDAHLSFDMKDLVRMLCRLLRGFEYLIQDIEWSQLSGVGVGMGIRDVGYEVEYVGKSFLVGDVVCSYLTHHTKKMSNIGTLPLKMNNAYDVCVEQVEVSTPQDNGPFEVDGVIPILVMWEMDIADDMVGVMNRYRAFSS